MKSVLVILLFWSGGLFAQESTIPQSLPFEEMILSVNMMDIDMFKGVWSNHIHAEESKRDLDPQEVWQRNLDDTVEMFGKLFPNHKREDFTFDFEEEGSNLKVYFLKELQLELTVVFEENRWKLDAH